METSLAAVFLFVFFKIIYTFCVFFINLFMDFQYSGLC